MDVKREIGVSSSNLGRDRCVRFPTDTLGKIRINLVSFQMEFNNRADWSL